MFLFLALLALMGVAWAPPGAAARAFNVPVPSSSIYFGAWVNPGNGSPSRVQEEAYVEQLEAQLNRRLATHLHYAGWESLRVSVFARDSSLRGDVTAARIPVISWVCGDNLTAIASGVDDAVVDSAAAALRHLAVPAFLRFFWEFDLVARDTSTSGPMPNGDAANSFTAGETAQQKGQEFINAWNHIRTRFIGAGATNVSWLWNPTGDVAAINLTYFYPGDANVDWIGVDHYDRTNKGFFKTFNPFYAWVTGNGYQAPVLIAETGELNADTAVTQSAYLDDAVTDLPAQFPQVKGFMWFDADQNLDWILDSGGIASFSAMGANPYFQAGNHATVLSVPAETDGPNQRLAIDCVNPIRGPGIVTIHVPDSGAARLDLYSLSGARVRTLAAGMLTPGTASIPFDAGPERPGVYFLRLFAGGGSVSRRIVLLR